MYSGGEFAVSKTVVGAVKDTDGPWFHFNVKPEEQTTPEDGVSVNGCGELSSDPCYFISEDPLIQVNYVKGNLHVFRHPGLVAIPEEKPAEEELYLPPLVAIPKEKGEEEVYLPPLIDLSGNEVIDKDIILLPLVAVTRSQEVYAARLGK
jgi:hypothetical protein